ncbi:MAG: hypothetical protein RJA61_308 [Candidatus Parcubacteria bacterium]
MSRRRTDSGSKAGPKLAIGFPPGKPWMLGGVRQGLVSRVRGEIHAGTYETDEKHAVAADALQAELDQVPAGRR